MPINPQEHLESIPPRFQGVYQRALDGGRTAAVKAMCLECMGWQEGCVRMVRECASKACPLWAVRPFQRKAEESVEDEQASINA